MKTMTLSIVMITKNSAEVVGEALESVKGMWSELLVDDDGSTDGTREIVRKYGATIVASGKKGFGERKQNLVEQATGDWILVLDADERVSEELRGEIGRLRDRKTLRYEGYSIPYQNYVFGKPVYYGGEHYSKVRLFRKDFGRVLETPLHEEIIIDKFHKATPSKKLRGGLGELSGVIHHHSYRTPWQLFLKFTRYAWIESRTRSRNDIIKKLFLYGPHMFWARYVKDKGYRDGWRGFVLAFAFGYMETATYWIEFIRQIFSRPGLPKG